MAHFVGETTLHSSISTFVAMAARMKVYALGINVMMTLNI